jgi:hypothetical protein
LSPPAPKTAATQAVEGFLSGAVGGLIRQAADANPPPPLAEDGEAITPTSITKQIEKHLATGDHIPAARLALILASWLARGEGLSFGEATKLAGLSWTQTAGLPAPPKLG